MMYWFGLGSSEAGPECPRAHAVTRRAARCPRVQQFNPDLKVHIEADEVEPVSKIVGELI